MAGFHHFDAGVVAELMEKILAVFPCETEGAHVGDAHVGDDVTNRLQIPRAEIAVHHGVLGPEDELGKREAMVEVRLKLCGHGLASNGHDGFAFPCPLSTGEEGNRASLRRASVAFGGSFGLGTSGTAGRKSPWQDTGCCAILSLGKMKRWIITLAAMLMGALPAIGAPVPPVEPPSDNSAGQSPALRKVLSDTPFFGTQSLLTLNGSYVNSPTEDYQQTGVWNPWSLPLSLEDMRGMIAEISFGDATRRGQWQLSYRQKVMTMDTEWQAIADSNSTLSLSDRRSQVLKASYNLRDWWKVGVAAVVEDRYGAEPTIDVGSFGVNNRSSLGFQFDTSLKF